jgi:RND family efflux transporter MFP subunit
MPKKPKGKLIRSIILFVVGGLAIYVLFVRPKSLTALVKKVALENKVVVRNVSASGTMTSDNDSNVSFSVGGKVTAIYVKKNDKVFKGQTLAVLDNSSSLQTADSLKNARDAAQRELDYFVLKKSDNVSLYGTDGYNIKLQELQERVSQANSAYRAQQAGNSTYVLTAPFNGTVLDVPVVTGETVAMTETVMHLADLDNMKFDVQLDQEDYGQVKLNQDVKINLNSYDGVDFAGKVTELPLYAEPTTQNFKVSITVTPDADHPIRLGMQGDAYIVLQTSVKEVPALTIDDIFYDQDNKPYVWVVKNGKLAIQHIETGIEGDIYTEVKTPITDTIVVPAQQDQKLTEGYTARIIN